jgi:starch phosphorylase
MYNEQFEKEKFKASVKDSVKNLFRKTIDEASPLQIFQAAEGI